MVNYKFCGICSSFAPIIALLLSLLMNRMCCLRLYFLCILFSEIQKLLKVVPEDTLSLMPGMGRMTCMALLERHFKTVTGKFSCFSFKNEIHFSFTST